MRPELRAIYQPFSFPPYFRLSFCHRLFWPSFICPSFQHPNISLICWDAVLLREIPKREGVRKPPSLPLRTAHARAGGRAGHVGNTHSRAPAGAGPGPARGRKWGWRGVEKCEHEQETCTQSTICRNSHFSQLFCFFPFWGAQRVLPEKITEKLQKRIYIYIRFVRCGIL